jgi:RNA polymerase sigma-70 factor (ECF subfamily)
MHEYADRLASGLVSIDDELACEFEARLVDSSALAVRVAYSVVRQQQDAEDVAQQALVRAYRHYRRLRDRDRFRAWLVRTTWRLALDWKRDHQRRARREQTAAALRPPSGNAESDVLASDRAARLWTAIDDLPGRLRLVLVLAAIEGHTMTEVAALVGLPEGTVKSRLFEARRRLAERLRCAEQRR